MHVFFVNRSNFIYNHKSWYIKISSIKTFSYNTFALYSGAETSYVVRLLVFGVMLLKAKADERALKIINKAENI